MSTAGEAALRAALKAYPMDPGLALHRAAEALLVAAVPVAAPMLEIGCHDGTFRRLAGALGLDVETVGCDLGDDGLDRAGDTGMYQGVMRADARRLPVRDASFGTVLGNSVLTHVHDLDSALAEIRRVLRPGGRLLATVPTPAFFDAFAPCALARRAGSPRLARAVATRYNAHWSQNHLLSEEAWRRKLGSHGFDAVVWTEYMVPRASFAWSALFLLGRAGRGRYTMSSAFRRGLPAIGLSTPVERGLVRALGPLVAAGPHGASALIVATAGAPVRPQT